MFFCVTDMKRRELSMLTAACVARAARISASSGVNSSTFLLSTCTTPMVLPRWFFIGAARMLRVRYPESMSHSGLKRGSL